jgi:aryl-alcohol dehydrogenase
LGATALDPTEGDQGIVERVKELTGGGATYGIDTTAKPEVVKQAQQSLGIRGTLVALGLGAEEYVLDAIDLLQAGKTVTSSIEGDSDPQEMVPRLIAMRAAGTFPMDDLVTTYPADEINRAVEEVTSGAVVKPVLVW